MSHRHSAPLYFPITTHIVGSGPWETVYSRPLGRRTCPSLREAQTVGAKATGGSDDFLIGVLDATGGLDDVLASNGHDLVAENNWDEDSFRAVADGLGLRWTGYGGRE